MTVNLNLKKTLIITALIVIACSGVWWYMGNAPQRAAKAEIKVMVDFLQRLTLENRIIEESSKLAGYRKQLAEAQKSKVQTPPPVPINPIIPGPKETEVKDE